MAKIEANCESCGAKFVTTQKTRKWCGSACAEKNRVKNNTYTCATCNTVFLSSRKQATYCSLECFGKSQSDRIKEYNAPRKKFDPSLGLSKSQQSYRRNHQSYLAKDNAKRVELIEFLGGKCVKCGYNEDVRGLVLDHKYGDGQDDRKRVGSRIYRYYVCNLSEALEKLQVLCATCNQIKAYENKEHNKSRRVIK